MNQLNFGLFIISGKMCIRDRGYSTRWLDGKFGNATRTALIQYQRDNGLGADGIAGCQTWRRIAAEVVGIGRTPTVIDP